MEETIEILTSDEAHALFGNRDANIRKLREVFGVDVVARSSMIKISGEKKQEEKVEKKDYYRVERSYGSFCRSFRLPENVNGDKAKASFKDGVLEVRLPKTKEGKQCYRCQDKPQECVELNLLDQKECAVCTANPKKECVEDKKTKEGKQCYRCQDKPQQCVELYLLDQKDCATCTSDPKKECIPDKKTKEGKQCYKCQDKPQECADLNLVDKKECDVCAALQAQPVQDHRHKLYQLGGILLWPGVQSPDRPGSNQNRYSHMGS